MLNLDAKVDPLQKWQNEQQMCELHDRSDRTSARFVGAGVILWKAVAQAHCHVAVLARI